MERALVTGGTGFTGSHLVRSLLSDGHTVRVVTRDADRARRTLPGEVDILEGDITDAAVIGRSVKGQDVVYHVAAAFREPGIPDRRYHEVHVDATRMLLEASRAEGVRRFVHCSTVGVHAHVDNPPADETLPYSPGDVYQETKSEGERIALEFQRQHDFPLAVARPTAIYGPGDLRLLKLFRMIDRGRFIMLGSGEVFFHLVYVSDLVQGLRLLADRPEAVGEVFIFGGPDYVSLNDLVSLIADSLGVRRPRGHLPVKPFYLAGAICEKICVPLRIDPPIYRRRVAFFMNSRAFSIEKARCALGYLPETDLRSGIRNTIAWYREMGYLPVR